MDGHGHKVYCMMNSGEPLTKTLADVLLFNAIDMYYENRRVQRIKARQYDGVIETNLKVCLYNGVPAVQFEALISTERWESNTVRFVVRVDDLDNVHQGDWGQLTQMVMGPMRFEDLPPEIQAHIRAHGGGPGDGAIFQVEEDDS